MKIALHLAPLLIIFFGSQLHCNAEQLTNKPEAYVLIQTGLNVNSFALVGSTPIHSLGHRNSIEYKKRVSDRVFKGYFFEHSTNIVDLGFYSETSEYYAFNWYCVGGDVYYRFATLFKFLSWEIGGGLGFIHLYKYPQKYGLAVNLGLNLNVRFSNRFSMDFAPLLFYPPVNRYVLSSVKFKDEGFLQSFSLLPIGLRFKL